jgi:hypothetical protein
MNDEDLLAERVVQMLFRFVCGATGRYSAGPCGRLLVRHTKAQQERKQGHVFRGPSLGEVIRIVTHDTPYGFESVRRLLVLSRFNSVTSCPLATNTMLAMPINRPCSTTPGISLSLRASAVTSGIRPNLLSRI